jgi:hypothetical protein
MARRRSSARARPLSLRSVLEAAAAEADRRRRRVRWALVVLAGALVVGAALLLGGQI